MRLAFQMAADSTIEIHVTVVLVWRARLHRHALRPLTLGIFHAIDIVFTCIRLITDSEETL